MRTIVAFAGALAVVAALESCTSGQNAVEPPLTQTNLAQTSKLQFSVGTASIGGTVELNTVETFRQQNGLSATLVNTPSIVGPAGFIVPNVPAAGADAGTNHITGSPQSISGGGNSTFGTSGGAFVYGFMPANSDTTGSANYPQYAGGGVYNFIYPLPFYSAPQLYYLGGPPAYPNIYDGNYLPGFAGYPQGFITFAAAPVVGTYVLTVTVATSDAGTIVFTASAALASAAALPSYPAPAYASDGKGGGSITVAPPAGVTETLAYVQDTATGRFYTFFTKSAGSLALPDSLGPHGGQSIPVGDTVNVYVVGFDYPAFEASPPASRAQTPAIKGPNGQSDLTVSAVTSATE